MSRVRGDKKSDAESSKGDRQPASASGECKHGTLIPRWDRVEDMGHEERVASYKCESCNQSMTPAEAREIRAQEAARLRG